MCQGGGYAKRIPTYTVVGALGAAVGWCMAIMGMDETAFHDTMKVAEKAEIVNNMKDLCTGLCNPKPTRKDLYAIQSHRAYVWNIFSKTAAKGHR